MRLLLNAFLQLIEGDASDIIVVAATNNSQMLDQALYRRFDDVLHYDLPTKNEIVQLFALKLGSFFGDVDIDSRTVEFAQGLSQAEITRICEELIKAAILDDRAFSNEQLCALISERSSAYKSKEA